jgi:Cu/Ag efflux protein CusF
MNRVRTHIAVLAFFGAVLLLSASTSQAQSSRQVTTSESVSGKATITAIDKATRTITLRNAQGVESKVVAGENVQRFDQLKVGDVITATYSQALAIKIRKPGAPAPQEKVENIVRDPHGATVTQQHTVSVTVQEIDLPNMSVTVLNEKGVKSKFKVRDVSNLRELKVGDKVDVTYTEGLLIRADHAQ